MVKCFFTDFKQLLCVALVSSLLILNKYQILQYSVSLVTLLLISNTFHASGDFIADCE